MFDASPIALRVFACFFALSVLITSGRPGSLDAGAQFTAAETLVATGSLGRDVSPGFSWIPGTDGKYYEAHDLGNVLLMVPAASLGVALDDRVELPDHKVGRIPGLALAFTYAAVAAIALSMMWLALVRARLTHRQATASLLLLIFATLYAAYQKYAYDVLGATLGVIGVLACLTVMSERAPPAQAPTRTAGCLGLLVGAAGLFRFSLLPALALGVTLALFTIYERRVAWRASLATLTVASLMTVPSLVYNARRTGSMVETGTSQYVTDAFGANLLQQFAELVLLPGKGLLFFCPLLLLGLLGLKRSRGWLRPLALGVFAYAILIALQPIDSRYSWGSRYLLPLVPVLWLAAVPIAVRWWTAHRGPLVGIVAVSAALGMLPLFAAWNDDLAEHTRAPGYGWRPVDFEAAGNGLLAGIRDNRYDGGQFTARSGVEAASGQHLPDFWWVQGLHREPWQAIMTVLVVGACLGVLLRSRKLLLRATRVASG